MNAWEEIKQNLAGRVRAEAFQNWVARTSYKSLIDGCLTVVVPNELTRDWMQTEYAPLVRTVILEKDLPVTKIEYEAAFPSDGVVELGSLADALTPANNLQLNPKFTFHS